MSQYKYMILPIDIILQEIIDEYQLIDKVENVFIMCEIRLVIYRLPQ